jgi:hypothetical protein
LFGGEAYRFSGYGVHLSGTYFRFLYENVSSALMSPFFYFFISSHLLRFLRLRFCRDVADSGQVFFIFFRDKRDITTIYKNQKKHNRKFNHRHKCICPSCPFCPLCP